MANKILYKIVGRYMNGNEVVAYAVVRDKDNAHGKLTREQIAYLIGKRQVVNCDAQIYKNKLILKGIGCKLDELPSKQVGQQVTGSNNSDGNGTTTGQERTNRTRGPRNSIEARAMDVKSGRIPREGKLYLKQLIYKNTYSPDTLYGAAFNLITESGVTTVYSANEKFRRLIHDGYVYGVAMKGRNLVGGPIIEFEDKNNTLDKFDKAMFKVDGTKNSSEIGDRCEIGRANTDRLMDFLCDGIDKLRDPRLSFFEEVPVLEFAVVDNGNILGYIGYPSISSKRTFISMDNLKKLVHNRMNEIGRLDKSTPIMVPSSDEDISDLKRYNVEQIEKAFGFRIKRQ